jgi:hypothetical protein
MIRQGVSGGGPHGLRPSNYQKAISGPENRLPDNYKMYHSLTGLDVLPILVNKSCVSDDNSTQLLKKLLACPPYFDSKPLLHDRDRESLVWRTAHNYLSCV